MDINQLVKEVTVLKDKEAIRNIIHRYGRSVDRCDVESMKACYWPDSFDDHGFFSGNGQEFGEYVVPILKQIVSSIHAMTNTIIDLDGDRAFSETQWSVVHRLADGEDFFDFWHQGRYLDVFEKRDGEWRIFVRTTVSDMDRLIRTKDMRKIMGAYSQDDEDTSRISARFPADAVYKGFGIEKTVRDIPGHPEFWEIFYGLAKVM